MELGIRKFNCDDNWYICLYTKSNGDYINTKEQQIAKKLGLNIEEYEKIFLDNRANIFHYIRSDGGLSDNIGYEFKTKEDAQKVIEILEPYLVMKELLK